ncbi:MAG: DoxX family protein, partial [Candidatus Acidiferrales bacterium]
MQVLDKLRPLGLLLLRLGLGIIFVSHGYPKLFGHTQQWIGNFQHMGFPSYFAYISGILEFFGGLL